jgi:hypothetical protein
VFVGQIERGQGDNQPGLLLLQLAAAHPSDVLLRKVLMPSVSGE